VNLREFAAHLVAAGVGHNPGRIRHRLAVRPCPFARVVMDDHTHRAGWVFDPEAVAWWLQDLEDVRLAQKEKAADHCRAMADRRRK